MARNTQPTMEDMRDDPDAVLVPPEPDRLTRWTHMFFFLTTWAMIIGLGAMTWQRGGWAWYAYAGVVLLIGIFYEAMSTRVAAEAMEPAVYALHADLRRLRGMRGKDTAA